MMTYRSLTFNTYTPSSLACWPPEEPTCRCCACSAASATTTSTPSSTRAPRCVLGAWPVAVAPPFAVRRRGAFTANHHPSLSIAPVLRPDPLPATTHNRCLHVYAFFLCAVGVLFFLLKGDGHVAGVRAAVRPHVPRRPAVCRRCQRRGVHAHPRPHRGALCCRCRLFLLWLQQRSRAVVLHTWQ